jgi:stalled ribosome rescue protein Dom34
MACEGRWPARCNPCANNPLHPTLNHRWVGMKITNEQSNTTQGTYAMSEHHYHAVVWIDHHEARVFHFSAADVERLVLHPDHPTRHIHHKANSIGSGHAAEDQAYLHATAQSIADAGAILIVGPANAKTELVKHIHHHDPKLMSAIVAVETVDHPSDAQIVAYAKRYFKTADRMLPQKP